MISLKCKFGMACLSLSLCGVGTVAAQDVGEAAVEAIEQTVEEIAEEGNLDDPAEPGQTPTIVCDEPEHQFGEVDSSTDIAHTFVIRNDGDALLEIGQVKPSCGCTVANITSKSLAPGDVAEISTKLSLKNKVGPQRKTISVQSNDPDNPKFTLTLSGVSTTEVDVKPRRVYVSDAVQGEPNEQTVTVTSKAETPLTITGVESGNPHITAEVTETEDGRVFTIVVQTTGELPKGQTHGRIRIDTDSEKYPLLNVPFQFNVMGELTVAPNEIAIVEQTDAQLTRNVVVRPGTVKEFEVTEVVAPVDTIETNVRDMAGNGYMIQLKNISPTLDLDGQKLIIYTDVEGMNEIEVPFRVVNRPKRT